MRVLIVSTSEKTGGAAVAASRLLFALKKSKVSSRMLVRDKQTNDSLVSVVTKGSYRLKSFLIERLRIFFHLGFSRKHLFDIDIANAGFDITSLEEFKQADVIHLHWINQGMLSLNNIRKILDTGKPVVWTMHDMWVFTAVCHCSLECSKFTFLCSNCKLLPRGQNLYDLSKKVFFKKKEIFSHKNPIHFVACSCWLEKEAKKSALLREQDIRVIPNPIDTNKFFYQDALKKREKLNLPKEKKLIAFVAQKVTNKLKGISYLIEACKILAKNHPQTLEHIAIVIIGGQDEQLSNMFPYKVYPFGYVSDENKLRDIYNCVDVYVLPSLSDNLPNTIMEAMASGTPTVGFNVGGIPEMIDHKVNGYLAKYKDSKDLALGIWWVLFEADSKELSFKALEKVEKNYSIEKVASKYIELYKSCLKEKS